MEAKTPSPCQPPAPPPQSSLSWCLCERLNTPFLCGLKKAGRACGSNPGSPRRAEGPCWVHEFPRHGPNHRFPMTERGFKNGNQVCENSPRFQVWFKLLTESSTPNPAGTKSGFYTKDRETCFGHASWLSGNQAEKS